MTYLCWKHTITTYSIPYNGIIFDAYLFNFLKRLLMPPFAAICLLTLWIYITNKVLFSSASITLSTKSLREMQAIMDHSFIAYMQEMTL